MVVSLRQKGVDTQGHKELSFCVEQGPSPSPLPPRPSHPNRQTCSHPSQAEGNVTGSVELGCSQENNNNSSPCVGRDFVLCQT